MARPIRLTPEAIDELRRDFEEQLSSTRLVDGRISYTRSFSSTGRKATLWFTEVAWTKMQSLIRDFDKEVAWHGIAERGEDPEKDEYTVRDILVYPQEVTGATVTTDQTEYQNWLMAQDDEVFNNLRMQGHSHVNMATHPSSVDTSLYERILSQLDDTMFYIFLIWNKKAERTIMIYDMAKNVMFETADVTVKIIDEGLGLSGFLEDARGKVRTRPTQTAYTQTPYTSSSAPISSSSWKGKTESAFASGKTEAKTEKDDGKQVKHVNVTAKAKVANSSGGDYGYPWSRRPYYDDDDDPYGPFGYWDSASYRNW